MAYLFDTSILVHAARGSRCFLAIDAELGLSNSGSSIAISIISQGEILAFAEKRSWGGPKRDRLRKLLKQVLVIPIDEVPIVERYAELEAANEKLGPNIGQNDLWIASTAIQFGLTLLTTDSDFQRCPTSLAYRQYDTNGNLLSKRP